MNTKGKIIVINSGELLRSDVYCTKLVERLKKENIPVVEYLGKDRPLIGYPLDIDISFDLPKTIRDKIVSRYLDMFSYVNENYKTIMDLYNKGYIVVCNKYTLATAINFCMLNQYKDILINLEKFIYTIYSAEEKINIPKADVIIQLRCDKNAIYEDLHHFDREGGIDRDDIMHKKYEKVFSMLYNNNNLTYMNKNIHVIDCMSKEQEGIMVPNTIDIFIYRIIKSLLYNN